MSSDVEMAVVVDPAKQATASSKQHHIRLLQMISSIFECELLDSGSFGVFFATIDNSTSDAPMTSRRGPKGQNPQLLM
ncbi:hypothetical protein JCGZ_01705 [Jatropha curcas]|uniref:Uncharacterized protein n=1 Tax=Jatropha curcas TaxID=180498 RepID=A0A067L612_JATCU|nr:hypothetical protein JCGZ_01705 [Jatropha curcas]